MFQEFKKFALKGNVVDLAIGVIIGGAFGKIVTSLVNDLIMPLIGLLVGGVDFSKLSFKVVDAEVKYGAFLQTVVDFLIIAFTIFMVIRMFNRFKKKQEEQPVTVANPDKKEQLLTEIRDLLKQNASSKQNP
ncbi:large conductance mechanosensitive channel protein MscL [Bacillus marasmi]|uniref:large conductance mechanosensitive channel protein MscL n=1 Tax=Bacillus marasmi TaxID=1926279 RepID=UPI0011CAFE3F|nr:large conductance mechanosensitive channel protein MscL [Bacillus marasmi]